MGDFDFDYWKLLAERDPVAYFAARDMTLRQFIASHPGQAVMLTELQARIDSTRVLAGGRPRPVANCSGRCRIN
jgi:hypothetical protein